MNNRDILALKILILDKIESESKDLHENSTYLEQDFKHLIARDRDWINLLEKVNLLK